MRKAFLPPIAATLALFAPLVGATAQRTFVSGSGGDSNPCSITSPCRSFGAAIAQTLDGGDIVVLDSAGYGPVSVTKNVAITAPAGVFAGITVTSGSGVDVMTAGLRVVLRGLTITGVGGNVGVHVGAASSVTVERCDIASMIDYGIRADAPGAVLHIADTTLRHNDVGISMTGAVTSDIVRSRVEGSTGTGIDISNGAIAEIRDSDVSSNGVVGIYVSSTTGFAMMTRLTLERVLVSNSGADGVYLYTSGGNKIQATIAGSAFTDNAGRGLRIESTSVADLCYAFVVDNRFVGTGGYSLDIIGTAGVATAYVARNAFSGPAYGVMKSGVGAYYLSGGGNIADQNVPPDGTASF